MDSHTALVVVLLAASSLAGCATQPPVVPSPDSVVCTPFDLGFTLEGRPKDRDAGLATWDLVLLNTGEATCQLSGRPGVTILAEDGGETIGQSIGAPAKQPVVVPPQGFAYALIEIGAPSGVACDPIDSGVLSILLPGGDPETATTIADPRVLFCDVPEEPVVKVGEFSLERVPPRVEYGVDG